eukprot:scaffold343236_cov92-Attheya_sp.AAC.1
MRLSERRSDGKTPRLMESGVCKTPYLKRVPHKRQPWTRRPVRAANADASNATNVSGLTIKLNRDYPNAIRLKLPKKSAYLRTLDHVQG